MACPHLHWRELPHCSETGAGRLLRGQDHLLHDQDQLLLLDEVLVEEQEVMVRETARLVDLLLVGWLLILASKLVMVTWKLNADSPNNNCQVNQCKFSPHHHHGICEPAIRAVLGQVRRALAAPLAPSISAHYLLIIVLSIKIMITIVILLR